MYPPDAADLPCHLDAEEAYVTAVSAPWSELREALYRELEGRIPGNDASVPVRHGPYFYYRRQEEGRPYLLHVRRRRCESAAEEEMLLDENALAASLGGGFFHLGALAVSPDHRRLLYAFDPTGEERFELRCKDLESGEPVPGAAVSGASCSLAWANDGRTFFYVALDELGRRARLVRRTLGASAAEAVLYEEADAAFHLSVGRSESGAYLLLVAASRTATEVRVLAADDPSGSFRLVRPRTPGVEYSLSHQGDTFYVLTNEGAPENEVLAAPAGDPQGAPWRRVVPPRPGICIEDLRAFSRHLVLFERVRGLPGIRILDPRTGGSHALEFPEPACSLHPEENREFDSRVLRFGYSSPVTPYSVFDYDMVARTRTLRRRTPVPSGFDPALYRTERLFARAPDGVDVPISVVRRRDLPLDGQNPLLLYGYGAYGICLDPTFSPGVPSLLDRGFIVAWAHVRGGGELGRLWHEGGKLLRKPKTFHDFIACAEHLVRRGYTASDRLAAAGASAGGLLIGAVANQRPDLFRALVAQAPFVDPLGALLDPEHPLAQADREEFGDPDDPCVRACLRSYSPCDNVAPRPYPAIFATAALHDARVPYQEVVRWVARLRSHQTGDAPVLLRLDREGGHAVSPDRFRWLEDEAFVLAFLIHTLPARPVSEGERPGAQAEPRPGAGPPFSERRCPCCND